MQSVSGMSDRLAQHLLRRLRREAERRAVGMAVDPGFLREEFVDSGGRVLQVFHRGAALPEAASGRQVVAMLARRRSRLLEESIRPVLANGGLQAEAGAARSPMDGARTGPDPVPDGITPAADIVRAVRAAAEPPKASEVATLLLVAQAVADEAHAVGRVLEVLRQRRPIVTVHCSTWQFEDCFLDLLARGLILPGEVNRCNGYDLDRRSGFYFPNMGGAKWQIVCFASKKRDRNDDKWLIGEAAQSTYPILAIAEGEEPLPPRLVAAAQLNLRCGGLNAGIVRRTIEVVLGEPPSDDLDDIDFGRLDLAELNIAIRPGSTPSSAVRTLRMNASDPDAGSSSGSQSAALGNKDSKDSSSGATSPARRGADHGSGSEIVHPKRLSGTDSDRFIERIETFSGCDEARDWALSLAVDLPLWQAGDLHWEEMSTKLLLSGPPGTGKTMFARSLCNTLQVPMYTTSVSTWLEPAYLGDVQRRIKRVFAEAVAHQPAILFIDEVDGVGRRADPAREYAEWWNALVNCLLERLDGAARTTGVIVVGATNHPTMIDPALLRPGRLSPHLEISLPDVTARMGILRHHLGKDLDSVVASAPMPTVLSSEDDLRAFLLTLPDAVLRQLAGK